VAPVSDCSAWALPSTLPFGVRTFLSRMFREQSPGPLTPLAIMVGTEERKQEENKKKCLLQNNLNKIAPIFGTNLDGTIEKRPRHSKAMLRFFRLRRVQRWPEDGMRDVQVILSQALIECFHFKMVGHEKNAMAIGTVHQFIPSPDFSNKLWRKL